jgi:phosphinothricin acetyltransferase
MPVVRHVTGADAKQIAAIYDPLVETTAISFEVDPPGPEEMRRRIEAQSPRHPWLVIEEAGQILGYACAAPYRERPAYRWSVETTVYLHPDHRGRGLGRTIYTSLLEMTRHRGFAGAFGRGLAQGGVQAGGVARRRHLASSPRHHHTAARTDNGHLTRARIERPLAPISSAPSCSSRGRDGS